jgi:hypothetical protein
MVSLVAPVNFTYAQSQICPEGEECAPGPVAPPVDSCECPTGEACPAMVCEPPPPPFFTIPQSDERQPPQSDERQPSPPPPDERQPRPPKSY